MPHVTPRASGRSLRTAIWFVAALAIASFLPTAANAAVTVNINQIGSDVVASAYGSLDLTGLTALGQNSALGQVDGAAGGVGVGSAPYPSEQYYSGFSGPSQFGSGFQHLASATSGDAFVIWGYGGQLGVPVGYQSGSPIDATSTWSFASFGSLGLTPGVYTYSLPSDSVIIDIGGVPEPATWAMMMLGFGGIGMALRRRRPVLMQLA